MEWLQLTVIFAIVSVHSVATSATEECACSLILALPNLHGSGPVPSWERGVEIVHGAQVAKERIDNLSKCHLELTEVSIGHCGTVDNFSLFEELITVIGQQKNSTANHQCLKVPIVVFSCNLEVLQYVISLSSEELIKESSKLAIKSAYKYMATMVRSAAEPLIGALFKFMKSQNWKKLGIITETSGTYFSRTAEEVYIKAKDDSNIDVIAYRQFQANERINFIRNPSKITLLSTSLETTVDILCSAYEENAVWPKYVWILHSYLLEDIKSIDVTCSISRALENVIFIRQKIPDEDPSYTNSYSIALNNSVWTSACKLFNLSIGEEQIVISHDVIEVTQVWNATEIALVDINGSDLNFLDDRIKGVIISDDFEMRVDGASTGYTVIFSMGITLGFVFVTIMLIGYTYFRNEPEVRSTNYMLSLLIFLGCYLNLIFLIFLLYFHQPILIPEATLDIICVILPWINILGLSMPLIIATVLVKLIRVYHIFNRVQAKIIGKQSSDIFLAGYVLLILLPLIIILIIWTIADPFSSIYRPSPQSGFIQKTCLSKYITIWLFLVVLYMVLLFSVLAIVAIKSRKIRQKNFKDTKKVNIFIFSLFFDILLPLSFWRLLGNLGTSTRHYISVIPFYFGHLGIVVLCQLLLIAPKLVAPFSRRLKRQ